MPVARRAITSKQKAEDPAEHAVAAVYLGGVKRTSHRSVERSCTALPTSHPGSCQESLIRVGQLRTICAGTAAMVEDFAHWDVHP
jgi:hypothetical protein